MPLTFAARLDGAAIHAEIGTDRPLTGAVWCVSVMSPCRVTGGELRRQVAGYHEVALPDLAPGATARLTLTPENPHIRPANRAWLPLGGYLRHTDGRCEALPTLPAGVRRAEPHPAPAFDGLRLVPPPTDWQPDGPTFDLRALVTDDPAVARADALARRIRQRPLLAPDGTPVAVEADPDLPPEGYRLTLAPDLIRIAAADEAGRFHAAVTLLTLRATHPGAVPCGTILDAPRFAWRGQHLDCARHYFAPATILRLLDLMALLKLNRFHWHVADDEAFRLELPTLPDLADRLGWRGEGEIVPGVFGGGIRSGGTYSTTDVAAIRAHAAANGILVMPEIEVPGHSWGLVRLRPDLRDPADTSAEQSVQGYRENALNPARRETWRLLHDLADAVTELFPDAPLHLGGDELAPGTWDGSPQVTALREADRLGSRDDVQGWTMAKLAAHLTARGVRAAAWEEAARGTPGIGHDALIFSWTGQGAGVEAARRGHDVVMTPAQHVYFDMAHTSDPDDWGAAWAAFVGLEDTIAWSPVPADAPDIAPRVIGVQGCFWAEFTTGDRQMEPMLAPRILGLSVKAWEPDGRTDGPTLRALAAAYGPVFDAMDWDCHRSA